MKISIDDERTRWKRPDWSVRDRGKALGTLLYVALVHFSRGREIFFEWTPSFTMFLYYQDVAYSIRAAHTYEDEFFPFFFRLAERLPYDSERKCEKNTAQHVYSAYSLRRMKDFVAWQWTREHVYWKIARRICAMRWKRRFNRNRKFWYPSWLHNLENCTFDIRYFIEFWELI